MDAAVYASLSNVIIGIRGNRVFQCSPTTGQILLSADLGTFGRNGCLAYDSGSNKVFCAIWNTPTYTLISSHSVSTRVLYRINPVTLAIELSVDIQTQFSLPTVTDMACQEAGICAMDSFGGNIYCRWWRGNYVGNNGLGGGTLRFSAANVATNANDSGTTTGGYPTVAHAVVGGHDCSIWTDQQGGPEIWIWDFVDGSQTTTFSAAAKNILAIGWAPVQSHIFVTNVAQVIYIYSTAGALLATADTTKSDFNGLAVRYNPNDAKIYVAGGNSKAPDGSTYVAQIDPSVALPVIGGGITMISGFDCCVDFVFAGAVRMAVQAGAVPLKPF